MKRIPPYLQARETSPRQGRIPRRILQTFETHDVPDGMHQASQSWINLNPGFDYHCHDDAMRREFVAKHFDDATLKCYDALPAGAFRADLWRYCALYVHGGVYADIDMVCRTPLGELIGPDDEFIIAHGNKRSDLSNGFICTIPRHAILRQMIERVKPQILAADFPARVAAQCELPYDIVGPRGLAVMVNAMLGRPDQLPFELGRQQTAGLALRVLEKKRIGEFADRQGIERHVVDGDRVVLVCKYNGYDSDLAAMGMRHWTDRSP